MTQRVIIWGLGKVGRALYEGMTRSSIGVHAIITRDISKQNLPIKVPVWLSEEVLKSPNEFFRPGDIIFVSVVDREIDILFQQVDIEGVTLIHCSGATSIIGLKNGNSGVFYPLQSFAGQGKEDWSVIPVFVEASNEVVMNSLLEIAEQMGVGTIEKLNSQQRSFLHLAGVFANNYTMAMAGIAQDLLLNQDLNPNWVLSILTKTAENFGQGKPWELMTGPASRADLPTIEHHRTMLENQPEMLAAYDAIAQYILNRYKHRSK